MNNNYAIKIIDFTNKYVIIPLILTRSTTIYYRNKFFEFLSEIFLNIHSNTNQIMQKRLHLI